MDDFLTTESVNLDTPEATDTLDTTTPEATDSLYTPDGTTPDENNNSVFLEPSTENSNSAGSQDGGNVINVDNDFGGDLASAIAAANAGDTVQLGSGTYNASGLTIDKDITVAGQGGSVVNGGGTSQAIFNLTTDADGASIEGIEITNANNGIYGFGASDVTLQNLNINNIGIDQPNRQGENNTGITLNQADGIRIIDSTLNDIGRKGIGLGDTNGGTISNVSVSNVNLAAEHAQNHDASGVKLFNTTDISVLNNNFSNFNAHAIWNDTTTGTEIHGNVINDVGADFIAPGFNSEVGSIYGIYNEKSPNSDVTGNSITAIDGFTAFNATEFTAETLSLGENDFDSQIIGSTDFYADEQAERLVATTENPTEANFELFSAAYYDQAIIG